MKHFNIRVSGKVQGVYFRASTREQADRLGVKGFVCNEANGDVYIEAESNEDTLNKFLEWCAQGPARASVDQIKVSEGAVKGFTSFEITR